MSRLTEALSAPRFATYLHWSGGDGEVALRLYTFNVNLSAALYGPLHMFEVALRNAADLALTRKFGSAWPDNSALALTQYQARCINEARQNLSREQKTGTHTQLIAELNLGFWTSLFGRPSSPLWQWLRPVFQTRGLQRPALASQLKHVRMLRNRVAHYEPILALPLAQRYAEITTLTGWISPDAAAWINRHSLWPRLHPAVPILMTDGGTKIIRVNPVVLAHLPPP